MDGLKRVQREVQIRQIEAQGFEVERLRSVVGYRRQMRSVRVGALGQS